MKNKFVFSSFYQHSNNPIQPFISAFILDFVRLSPPYFSDHSKKAMGFLIGLILKDFY